MKNIQKIIEQELGIDDLFKKCRKREYVEARSVYDKAMRMFTKKTFQNIGDETNRKHDYVLYSANRYESNSFYNKKLQEVFEKVRLALFKSRFIVQDVDLKNGKIILDY